MSTLPDIDTGSTGYIAFFNALEQGGVGNFDPEELLTDSSIVEYTLYDNGWEGVYSGSNQRNVKVRAKTDGWIVVYMDRRNYFTFNNSPPEVAGYYDICFDRRGYGTSFNDNEFETIIKSLASNADNSIQVNTSDIGLFNFEYPDATASTGLTTGYLNAESTSGGFLYTDGTELKYASLDLHQSGNFTGAEFDGVSYSEGTDFIADLIAEGMVEQSGYEYRLTIDGGGESDANASILTIWS